MSRPADDALYVRYLTLVRKHLSYAAADELDADRALSDYGLDSQGTTGLVFAVEAEARDRDPGRPADRQDTALARILVVRGVAPARGRHAGRRLRHLTCTVAACTPA